MATETRQLGDLISVGPAMLRDFEMLGIRSVEQLAEQDPRRMYERLGRKRGQAGPVRAGHLLRGRGAGAESALARRAMRVVVLEPQEEVGEVSRKEVKKTRTARPVVVELD